MCVTIDLFPTAVRTASGSKGILSVENPQTLPIKGELCYNSLSLLGRLGGFQHPQNRGAKVGNKDYKEKNM
jgi:hypothetical protein